MKYLKKFEYEDEISVDLQLSPYVVFSLDTGHIYYQEYVNMSVGYADVDPVDLGLTSGTLWSPINLGASDTYDAGDYFAWGSTAVFDSYTEEGYLDYMNFLNITSYNAPNGKTRLQDIDDPLSQSWAGGWHIPTIDQWKELTNETTIESVSSGGIDGLKFTGSNGNYIIIPFVGYKSGTTVMGSGSAKYLSLDLDPSSNYSSSLVFSADSVESIPNLSSEPRYLGFSVRPVLGNKEFVYFEPAPVAPIK